MVDLRDYVGGETAGGQARAFRVSEEGYVEHPMVRERAVEGRRYQLEMAEGALKANTLLVLPTALGKTVIAELVIAEVLRRYPGCRVMFLAPTKPLALQHRESLLRHLKLGREEVAVVTGEVRGREGIWLDRRVRVVLGTPQAVWNDMSNGLVALEEFALLVLDECHRSKARYAYTRIASEYVRRCPWPLILALTASPGSTKESVTEVVRNLWIERIEWRTEDDEDVRPYIPGVKVGWVRVQLTPEYERVRDVIRKAIERRVEALRSAGLIGAEVEVNRKVLLSLMERLKAEAEAGARGPRMRFLQVISQVLSLFHALELVESQHVRTLLSYLESLKGSELRSHVSIVRSEDFAELLRAAESCTADHPKVTALVSAVRAHLAERPQDRVLVFANVRVTAEVLAERLRSEGIDAALFVGKAEGKGGPRMTQEEQMRVLRDFREGRTRVLVATSIGEEGLDVPECGLVVFYEPIPSGIRHVQRRGRTGRRMPGKVLILVTEGTVEEYYFREGYRRARRMASILEEVSREVREVLVPRSGPMPTPGEPWPWRRPESSVLAPETVHAAGARGDEERTDLGSEAFRSAKELRRAVERTRKDVYLALLKSGRRGMTLTEVMESVDEDPDVVRRAAFRLVRERKVARVNGRFVTRSSLRASSESGALVKVEVEKVGPGYAVVLVNDRFRARLDADLYYGPRELVKKGRRFLAKARILKQDGRTVIVVHDVVQVLE
ncbi:MAG: helicase-related protein [Nitrososphaerota archaeon]